MASGQSSPLPLGEGQGEGVSYWTPTGGLLPIHDTSGITDALMSGGFAGVSLLMSCTSNDGTTTYSHDPTGELIGATWGLSQFSSDENGTVPLPADESYSYDLNGNRITANGSSYTTGADNRLISDGTYRYEYDAEGNRTERYIDVNADGVLDAGDTDITQYAWDNRNRLIEVTNRAVFGGDPTQIVQYGYDPENRMVAETVDSNGDGVVDYQFRFVYDGNQIVLQFEKDGAGDLTGADESHRYLSAVDQVFADEQVANPQAAGNVVWPLANQQGTINDLAVYNNQTGITSVANHRVFNTFGDLKSQTNAAVDCLFGFTGLPFDSGSQTYRTPTRPYDPQTGRWDQPDWINELGGQTNLYAYCGNSPTNATDPNGTQRTMTISKKSISYLGGTIGIYDLAGRLMGNGAFHVMPTSGDLKNRGINVALDLTRLYMMVEQESQLVRVPFARIIEAETTGIFAAVKNNVSRVRFALNVSYKYSMRDGGTTTSGGGSTELEWNRYAQIAFDSKDIQQAIHSIISGITRDSVCAPACHDSCKAIQGHIRCLRRIGKNVMSIAQPRACNAWLPTIETERLMVFLALLLGLIAGRTYAMAADESSRQLDAIKHIEQLGGYVKYAADTRGREVPAEVWLDGWGMDNAKLADAMKYLEHLSSTLTAVSLQESRVTDLRLVGDGLPGLKMLNLYGSEVTDQSLAGVTRLKRLEKLTLRSTKVTDAGLPLLTKLPSLQWLDLSSMDGVTAKGLGPLKSLPKLTALKLSGANLKYDDWTDVLATKKALKDTSPAQSVMLPTDAGLKCIADLRQLEDLDLSVTGLQDDDLKYLRSLTNLRGLWLYENNLTDVGLKHLAKLTKLRYLILWGNSNITDAGLQAIGELVQLDELSLAKTRVTGNGLANCRGLVQLKHLDLSDTPVSDAGIGPIGTFGGLETLDLEGTQISDAGLKHLEGLACLKALVLSKTQVTDAGLKHLEKLTNLRELSLMGTQTTEAGKTRLRKALPQLKVY